MARIRTIKPEFFLNEQLAACDHFARLLFIGLWTQADRAGRLEDRPARLRVALFPYDADANVEAGLSALAEQGLIVRYTAPDGRRLLAIPTWEKHQQPHMRERASELPAPDEHSASTMLAPDKHFCSESGQKCQPVGREGKGREGIGEGNSTDTHTHRARATASGPLAGTLPRDHIDHAFCGAFCVSVKTLADMVRQYNPAEGEDGEAAVLGFLGQLNARLAPGESHGGPLWMRRHFEAWLMEIGRVKPPVAPPVRVERPMAARAVPSAAELDRQQRAVEEALAAARRRTGAA